MLLCEVPTWDFHPATRMEGQVALCNRHSLADLEQTRLVWAGPLPDPPHGPGLDDSQAAAALGSTWWAMRQWREMGFSWHRRPGSPRIEVWHSGHLAGVQDGPGPMMTVVTGA
jgi:hypothetical protein